MFLSNGHSVPIPPQALAELVPQLQTSYYYPDNVGLSLEREYAMYGEIYKRNPWVHLVINKRANAIARLPIAVWNETGPERTLDLDSAYAKLIGDPCSGYLDPFTFWNWLATTWDLYGEAYLAIFRDSKGIPFALFPMHPTRVAIKRDPDTGRYQYLFQGGPLSNGDGLVQFDQDDVVPFRSYNPLHVERGLSRLEPLRSTIMSEDSSRNATSAMWRNAGRPNLVLESDKRLGDSARKNIKDAFQSLHAGSSNAGQTLVLEQGLTAKQFQLTAVEMEFIGSLRLNREEICAAYDIAPTMVHILDHATFSNISAQMRAFYRDTMAPFIEAIESVLDHYVGKNFGIYKTSKRVARFAVDEIIRGDFEIRAEASAHLIGAGVATPNEARHLMGLNRHEDPMADRLLANSTIQPLGTPAERITLTGEIAQDPDGIPLRAPATTNFPSQDGASHSVPRPALPPPSPSKALDYTAPHLRELKSGLGRGADVRELARRIAEKYPNHLDDILAAVEIAIRTAGEAQRL